MTAAELAARCPGAKRTSSGFRARCPAHGSRGLTLAIGEGRDGCAVVHCHAGCDYEKILAAIGVTAPLRGTASDRTFTQHVVSGDEIREALISEAKRYRSERGIALFERLVAADLDMIRRTVSARLGISLPKARRTVSDSDAGGYERDPLWPLLLDHAWYAAWIRYDGREPCCSIDQFAAHGAMGLDLLEHAERDAVAAIRALSPGARGIAA